jgi:predicted metal-binding protein
VEREAFFDGYYKAFAMGAGPCSLCDECNLEDEECLYPEDARPSMESCGIDVFQTVRNNGLPIEVVKNHNCEQNYYGIVLIE